MGRPFYPHEADDPDLDWLVTNFLYERPGFIPVEADGLPLMLLPFKEAPAADGPYVDDGEASDDGSHKKIA